MSEKQNDTAAERAANKMAREHLWGTLDHIRISEIVKEAIDEATKPLAEALLGRATRVARRLTGTAVRVVACAVHAPSWRGK